MFSSKLNMAIERKDVNKKDLFVEGALAGVERVEKSRLEVEHWEENRDEGEQKDVEEEESSICSGSEEEDEEEEEEEEENEEEEEEEVEERNSLSLLHLLTKNLTQVK